jgi:hypothetical protein
MNIDLDINNYNYQDLLNIFKINNGYSPENISKINDHCKLVQQNFSNDIYTFYLKAYQIVKCIYNIFNNNNNNSITNFDDNDKINFYVNKIKKIKSFEKLDDEIIINNILNINTKEPSISYKDINNKTLLNEPTYNLSGRVNPDLNGKNITNIIVDTFPNSLAPGELNSIKRITLSQNFNFNSCFRHNYYTSSSTDFQYLLPCEIKNVVSLRLASIEIPNVWYLFSHKQKNNTFSICVKLNGIIEKYNIVIHDGNYDNESLQDYLNNTFFYQSGLDNLLKYIRFSIDPFNFKTKFEIIDDMDIDCSLTFSLAFIEDINDNVMNTAGWILGFRLPNYLEISECIFSEGLFDGSSDRYIYFILNDYQYNTNSTNIVFFDKSSMEENILAKIPMINGKLSLIIDDNNNPLTKTRKYNGPVNIKKIHIKILDKFGNVIDLNNMDFSFTIEVEILYESFNFKDILA